MRRNICIVYQFKQTEDTQKTFNKPDVKIIDMFYDYKLMQYIKDLRENEVKDDKVKIYSAMFERMDLKDIGDNNLYMITFNNKIDKHGKLHNILVIAPDDDIALLHGSYIFVKDHLYEHRTFDDIDYKVYDYRYVNIEDLKQRESQLNIYSKQFIGAYLRACTINRLL